VVAVTASPQGQGKIIDGEAQQFATTAQNYAHSHCG
jgi:hypothetical protein